MADDILVKQDGPILRITINAPDRGNAVTDEMVIKLTKQQRQDLEAIIARRSNLLEWFAEHA